MKIPRISFLNRHKSFYTKFRGDSTMKDEKSKHIPGTDPKPEKGNDSDKRPDKQVPITPARPHALLP